MRGSGFHSKKVQEAGQKKRWTDSVEEDLKKITKVWVIYPFTLVNTATCTGGRRTATN